MVPVKFLAPLPGRSFFLIDIDNNAFTYYFRSSFNILFYFIHLTLVLVTWSLQLFVCGFKEVNLRACEDRVKANYVLLISS